MADLVSQMEKHLRKQYETAQKDVEKKLKQYFKKFKKLDAQKQKAVKAGTLTQEEYETWRRNKLLYGAHWEHLKENITEDLFRVNEIAVKYINGQIPDIFVNAYNHLETDIPKYAMDGYSFELVNSDTVAQLAKAGEIMLPPPKDLNKYKDKQWNKKNVNAAVLQGILQGESMDAIAERVAKSTKEKNLAVAMRNGRTMVTAAENSGRAEGIKRAEKDGVILDKIWRATSDSRTRDSHAVMNGERVPSEKPFSNGLMFPGDWNTNNPAEVYNCRCTLITKFVGFDNKRFRDSRSYPEIPRIKEDNSPINTRAYKMAKYKNLFANAADSAEREKIVNEAGNVLREEWMQMYDVWKDENNRLSEAWWAKINQLDQEIERLEKEYNEHLRNRELFRTNGDTNKFYEMNFYITQNRNKFALVNDTRIKTFDEFCGIIEKSNDELVKRTRDFVSNIRTCGYGSLSPTDFFIPADVNERDEHLNAIVSNCFKSYPTDWIERTQNNKSIETWRKNKLLIGYGDRGHYNINEIILDGKNDKKNTKTAYHELMHYLEDNVPDILETNKAFYKRRTAGNEAELLRDVTRNAGYRDDEYTKVDDFIDAYMGKVYADGSAFETLSMGMENLFTNPSYLMSDEDYFNHVLGIFAIC